MLDVNTLPKSYRKVEEFEDDVGQMDVDRKRTEEERMLIQNKVCEKRWRVTRCSVSLLLTFIPTQLAHRPTKETFNFTGRPHKIPKMSQIRYET